MSEPLWQQPLDATPLHRIARHGRIWRRTFTISMAREAQFRANAISTILVGSAQVVISMIPIFLLFEFTRDVNGWSRPEVIALLGLFQIITGIIETFLQPNMFRFTELIVNGELDSILLRPISSQFFVTSRRLSLPSLFGVVSGLFILAIGLRWAEVSLDPVDIVLAGIVCTCGIVLLACVWSAMVYIAFWSTSVHSIAMLFSDLWYAGSYPLSFFPVGIRVVLTVVFPVAFATTVPIETLLGQGSGSRVVVAFVAAIVAVWLVRAWWRLAVRSYSSASS